MNNIRPKYIKPVLSGAWLKLIAIIAMVIDHVAIEFFVKGDPIRPYLRGIGRIAFPIFCFLLVEGALKTNNIKKYALRLFIFALVSEIPFNLVGFKSFWYIQKQNTFFTLLLGLLMVWILQKTTSNLWLIVGVFGCGFAAYLMKTDYGMWGIALILAFYVATIFPEAGFSLFIILMFFKGGSEYWGLFSIIPIALYNGERGKQFGHILYLVYPVHLMIIHILWCLTNGTSIFTF